MASYPADDSVIGTESIMTDDAIVSDALNEENAVNEEIADCDASNKPACLQSSDVRQALDVLRDYMLYTKLLPVNVNIVTLHCSSTVRVAPEMFKTDAYVLSNGDSYFFLPRCDFFINGHFRTVL